MKIKKLPFIKTRTDLIIFFASIIFIIINLIFSTYHFFVGDIFFHTDIARDMLLVEELFEKGSPVLIGPRAGGIGGTFFGPVWIYLSAPFYFIGNGNPMSIGLMYWMLAIFALVEIIYISNKVFKWQVAAISGAIFSFYVVNFSLGYTQTFGSVIIAPIIFYLVYKFLITKRPVFLIFLMLSHGLLLQFQPAFGALSLSITLGIVTYKIFRIRKFKYLLSFFLIFIPLLNYAVFEIRNNFLQIRAFFHFLTYSPESAVGIPIVELISNRIEFFMGRLNLLQVNSLTIGLGFLIIFIYILYRFYKYPSKDKKRLFVLLFYLYYLAFFCLSFLFKGLVWDFYTLGFLPIAVIVFSTLYFLINKKAFLILVLIVFIVLSFTYKSHYNHLNTFTGHNPSSWITNKNMAEYIFNNEKNDFGFFVFSPDEFGYSQKYAMSYVNKLNEVNGELCKKHETTYVIYTPHKFAPGEQKWWKNNKLRINKDPITVDNIGSLKIEKYIFSEEERLIEHDPTVICDLHFR